MTDQAKRLPTINWSAASSRDIRPSTQLPDIKNPFGLTRSHSYMSPLINHCKLSQESPPFHGLSPYEMPNDSPGKYFVSGYSGFIPRNRFQVGAGFPVLSHFALNEFSTNLRRTKLTAEEFSPHVRGDKFGQQWHNKEFSYGTLSRSGSLYRPGQGITPRYMGHIPGERFRFGETFGNSTKRVAIPTMMTATE